MQLSFSIIIPVYNRPDEVDALLKSLSKQNYNQPFEIIIVEDGSSNNCIDIVHQFSTHLDIKYFLKENTGAGKSRNFGMTQAKGNYYIILDSDVIVPQNYLRIVQQHLFNNFTDIYGGPDSAHSNFSAKQKAINYAMTSFYTTGGLRGGKNYKKNFQPRSFNMGISKYAFEKTGGFSGRKIGEDIELSLKIKTLGLTSQLIIDAFVFHKRRSTFQQFFKQTFKFGSERPLLNLQFPNAKSIVFWFPSFFVFYAFFSIVLLFWDCYFPIASLLLYFLIIFVDSTLKNRCIKVGFLSIIASNIQFIGYGIGFFITIIKKKAHTVSLN